MRVAPNELSFNTAQSWRDIYEKKKGQATFIKSDFYDGGNFAAEAHSIVSVRDPDEHANMRRYLRDAFSDRSLRDQEYLISEVVDRFVERIGEEGEDNAGIDIVRWFNLATFDSKSLIAGLTLVYALCGGLIQDFGHIGSFRLVFTSCNLACTHVIQFTNFLM